MLVLLSAAQVALMLAFNCLSYLMFLLFLLFFLREETNIVTEIKFRCFLKHFTHKTFHIYPPSFRVLGLTD